MNSPDLLLAVKPVVNAFKALSIPYYIGGSIASSLYGIARATMDVDIVAQITPTHVTSFVNSLKDAYYIDEQMILDAISSDSSFNLIHIETTIKVDVFVQKTDPFHLSALERRQLDRLVEDDQESDF